MRLLIFLLCLYPLGALADLQAAFHGSSVDFANANTVVEYKAHRYESTLLLDYSVNDYDATINGTPVWQNSPFQRWDGNCLVEIDMDGSTDYLSKSHEAAFNIFDSDHTVTVAFKADATGDVVFSHWSAAGGMKITQTDATTVTATYENGVAPVLVTATCANETYHIVHVVRSSNTATVYCDGVAGTPTDVTNKGDDVSVALTFGANSAGAAFLDGQFLYGRVDNVTSSVGDIIYEAGAFLGMATNQYYAQEKFDVVRSTIATTTSSTGRIKELQINTPRVAGKGGGLLVEEGTTNLIKENQDLNDAGTWTIVRSTVPTTDATAPDGSATADVLHEDATAANSHVIFQAVTITSGTEITMSVFVKKLARTWFRLSDIAGGSRSIYFDLDKGKVGASIGGDVINYSLEPYTTNWWRCSMTYVSTTTSASMAMHVASADNTITFDGLDQDSLYLWMPQTEEKEYETSTIYTETTAVARTADDITMDALVLGDTATAFTVEFDVRCLWDAAANIDNEKTILEISGNTGTASDTANRLRFYAATDGKIHALFSDAADADHDAYTTADVMEYGEWFSVKAFWDGADFSNNTLEYRQSGGVYSSTGVTYSGNSGTGSFDTTGTEVRIGQEYDGDITGDCRIRNVLIVPRPR